MAFANIGSANGGKTDPRVAPLAFQDDDDGRAIVDVHQVVRG